MGRVISETLPARSIGREERARMYQLMEADYLGMEPASFDKDFQEKDEVMLLREEASGTIVGFSTLMVMDFTISELDVHAVFSGDTIVQSEFRHTFGLGIELGKYFRLIAARHPSDLVVWILTSKGCRTYGILPLLFREFCPRWDAPTPPLYSRIMDAFGERRYLAEYDPADHLIRHAGTSQRMRVGVADATARRLRDPHARFFMRVNPGHMNGDELVCAADARERNWTPRFQRMIEG